MKINELVGKNVQLYPGDTHAKFGTIVDWNEYGFMVKITKSDAREYAVGNSIYFSHSKTMTLKIM